MLTSPLQSGVPRGISRTPFFINFPFVLRYICFNILILSQNSDFLLQKNVFSDVSAKLVPWPALLNIRFSFLVITAGSLPHSTDFGADLQLFVYGMKPTYNANLLSTQYVIPSMNSLPGKEPVYPFTKERTSGFCFPTELKAPNFSNSQ